MSQLQELMLASLSCHQQLRVPRTVPSAGVHQLKPAPVVCGHQVLCIGVTEPVFVGHVPRLAHTVHLHVVSRCKSCRIWAWRADFCSWNCCWPTRSCTSRRAVSCIWRADSLHNSCGIRAASSRCTCIIEAKVSVTLAVKPINTGNREVRERWKVSVCNLTEC